MPADLTYLLRFDDEVLPLSGNMTIGRHLDCDAMVAGEDVLDYHLRIEVDERGPTAYPLQDATFSVNGTERAAPLGLVVGDTLGVGSMMLQIGVERETAAEAEEWWLYEEFGDDVVRIDRDLLIGRQGDCDVVVASDHVSRHHARLTLVADAIWVSDLDSANGTTINGTAISGSRRLLHGDIVRFDEVGFQLVGRGGELTGVRRPTQRDLSPLADAAETSVSLPQARAPEVTELVAAASPPIAVEPPDKAGVYLLVASGPAAGEAHLLRMGRLRMGRSRDADLPVHDASVSSRHAELAVRPEGVTVTNLLATNGTFVNEQPVHVAELKDGDVVRLGRVQFVYRVVADGKADRWAMLSRLQVVLGIGVVLAAVLLAWLLLG